MRYGLRHQTPPELSGADRFFPNLDQAPAWVLAEVEGPYVYGDLAYTYCTYRRREAKTTAPGWDRDGPGPGAVFEVDPDRKCGKCKDQTAGSASWAGKGAGGSCDPFEQDQAQHKAQPLPGQGGDPNGLPAGEVGEHQDGRRRRTNPRLRESRQEAFPWPRAVKNPARRMLIPASR